MSTKTAEEIRQYDEDIAKDLERIAKYQAKLEASDDESEKASCRNMIRLIEICVRLRRENRRTLYSQLAHEKGDDYPPPPLVSYASDYCEAMTEENVCCLLLGG